MQSIKGQDSPSQVSAIGLSNPSQQNPSVGSSQQISPLRPPLGPETEATKPILLAKEESKPSYSSTPPVKSASMPMIGLCCMQNVIAFVTFTHIVLLALCL